MSHLLCINHIDVIHINQTLRLCKQLFIVSRDHYGSNLIGADNNIVQWNSCLSAGSDLSNGKERCHHLAMVVPLPTDVVLFKNS